MSIVSTALSLGKSALGFLTPAGGALKLAPWAIAGACALGLYIEHERLVAADAGIKAANAQTALAVQKCQAENAQAVAAASVAAAQQQATASVAASQAETQLFGQRAAQQVAAQRGQQALGVQLGAIATEANQSGWDGPVPRVLGSLFP